MAAPSVTTWYLEMAEPTQLVPPPLAAPALAVREVAPPDPGLLRRFYLAVGDRYHWVDRRAWTPEDWAGWVARTALTTLIASVDGAEAGFAVLDSQGGGDVELAYFGLLPAFIGRGYGGSFLHEVTRRAWALGARRVWLHTCSLDHPAARRNYEARGFRVFRVEGPTP
jgi:GNAT superfamily N-acetyltransferase